MAKKQRTVRPPRSADMSRYGGMASSPTAGTPSSAASAPKPTTAGKGTPAAAAAVSDAEYAAEHHYVFSDLRRIAILAGSMFALLIVLSLIVR